MKVAYILNIFPKVSETFILNEIIEVQNNNFEVNVFSFSKINEDFVHKKVKEVKNVHYLSSPKKSLELLLDHLFWFVKTPFRYLKTLFIAVNIKNGIFELFFFQLHNVKMITNDRPDVVHSHFGVRPSDMAMLVNLITGIPFTFTTHGFDVFYHPPTNYRLKSRLALKHIAISQYNKDYLIKHFGISEKCIDVVHCGIDFDRLPLESFPKIKKQIICVARLVKEKALDNLIKACAILSRCMDFKCIILGDGLLREELNGLIVSLSLTEKVYLLGYKPHDEILAVLKQSSVMVLTSRSEGIPVSLMEAMALRTPVIATRITGIPELIEDEVNGFLVEVDDVFQLVDRIKKILNNDPCCMDFCTKAYEKILREFNLKIEVKKLISHWKI